MGKTGKEGRRPRVLGVSAVRGVAFNLGSTFGLARKLEKPWRLGSAPSQLNLNLR